MATLKFTFIVSYWLKLKQQISEIESINKKEALLKERLIQIKMDEIVRLELSDGM